MGTSISNGTTATAAANGHLGERLHALLDHELDAAGEAEARAHLAACPDCRRQHQKLAGVAMLASSLGRARAPEGFAARLIKRMRAGRRGDLLKSMVEHKVLYEGTIIVVLAAAMAACVLAFASVQTSGLFAKNEKAHAPVATGTPEPVQGAVGP